MTPEIVMEKMLSLYDNGKPVTGIYSKGRPGGWMDLWEEEDCTDPDLDIELIEEIQGHEQNDIPDEYIILERNTGFYFSVGGDSTNYDGTLWKREIVQVFPHKVTATIFKTEPQAE